MNYHKPFLSVVVAAYNEEAVIDHNLHRIVEELSRRSNVDWELICINDGSTDKTGEIIEAFSSDDERVLLFHHRRNFGQGRALRTAFNMCKGEIIVTLDADLSYGPQYIYRLVDALAKENVEIALASPYKKGGAVRNVPFYRHLLSRLGNIYLAKMSRFPVSTSTCVVRAYQSEVLDNIFLTSDGMEIQLEILMKASMLGYGVCEVPARLEWADEKAADADFKRISKMKILGTIRLYLLMGWLSRPAFIFMIISLMFLLPGIYMALILTFRLFSAIARYSAEGIVLGISHGLDHVFTTYTYSVAFCGGFLLIGIQILVFALLFLQNKIYFDELYRLGQYTNFHKKPTEK